MSRPLRVLQVAPRLHPDVGGVETHVREVARRLRALGADVTLLTADPTHALPARDELDGAPLLRARAWPRGRDWMFAPGIARTIARGGWDVVHVQAYHTFVAPLAMAAAARARVPYVLTFHGGGHSSRLRTSIRGLQVRAQRPLLMRAHALVSIADFEIAHYGRLAGLPAGRFVTIPNGAELPAPAAVPAGAAGPLIVSSGRLERYKGHHRAIAALPHVLGAVPDARLWIAGAGPEADRLRSQAEALGIGARVEIGVADRATLAGRLQGASLALLLSDFETQPLAALEAASLGVPLVVADNSGMRELASKGLARTVALADAPERHAAVMVRQLREPLRPAEVALPAWDDCAAGLLALYEQAARRA